MSQRVIEILWNSRLVRSDAEPPKVSGDRRRMWVSARVRFQVIVLSLMGYVCYGPVPSVDAIVTSDESGSHAVVGGTAFGEDLTGLANISFLVKSTFFDFTQSAPLCGSALISDRHLLTAAHCVVGLEEFLVGGPVGGEEVSVQARFVTSGGDVHVPIDLEAVSLVPGWPDIDADLAIVELAAPAPEGARRYPIYVGSDEIGKQVIVAGFGAVGHGATGEEPRVLPPPGVDSTGRPLSAGLNRLEELALDPSGQVEALVFDFDSGLPENNTLQLSGVESDIGFGFDEVGMGSGDSGGPVIYDGAIIGVMFATQNYPDLGDVTPEIDGSWGELGLAIRTSNYRDFIATATSGEAVFVPEPASGHWLLAAFAVLCAAYSSRSSRRHVRDTQKGVDCGRSQNG